jgi:NifU-like protein
VALTEKALALAQDVRFRGPLDCADRYAVAGSPGDGPYFELWLKLEPSNGSPVIRQASYNTHGCPSSMAVGGALCALITGRVLTRVADLNESDIRAFAGELPEGKEFNYRLAAEALRLAVSEDIHP